MTSAHDLRPRSPLELADVSVSAVRRWFPDLVAASLLFCLPVAIAAWGAALVAPQVGLLVGVVGGAVGLALAHAACVAIIGSGWLGGSPSWRTAAHRMAGLTPDLVALWLIGAVCVAAGGFVLIVPGVVLALGAFPAVPVLVLEHGSPWRSFARSQRLSADRRASHLVAVVALLGLVSIIVAVAVQPIVGLAVVLGDSDAQGFAAAAAAQLACVALVVPLLAALTTALFLDARVRKEGLDLAFLLERLREATT